jgi:hypothetical protein
VFDLVNSQIPLVITIFSFHCIFLFLHINQPFSVEMGTLSCELSLWLILMSTFLIVNTTYKDS